MHVDFTQGHNSGSACWSFPLWINRIYTCEAKCISTNFLFKSNERSEDSYLGLADFFLFLFPGKVSNSYRCAFIHIDAFTNALRYICTCCAQLIFIIHLLKVS